MNIAQVKKQTETNTYSICSRRRGHTSKDQLSARLRLCAHVRVNIRCKASDIKFNKEFTFQIEGTSSVKCVDPQTAISSVSVKHVRKCKPWCRLTLNGINSKNLQALCLIGPPMIFSYRTIEDLSILIFYEQDFADSGQLLEINELRLASTRSLASICRKRTAECITSMTCILCVCIAKMSVTSACLCVYFHYFSCFFFPSSP